MTRHDQASKECPSRYTGLLGGRFPRKNVCPSRYTGLLGGPSSLEHECPLRYTGLLVGVLFLGTRVSITLHHLRRKQEVLREHVWSTKPRPGEGLRIEHGDTMNGGGSCAEYFDRRDRPVDGSPKCVIVRLCFIRGSRPGCLNALDPLQTNGILECPRVSRSKGIGRRKRFDLLCHAIHASLQYTF